MVVVVVVGDFGQINLGKEDSLKRIKYLAKRCFIGEKHFSLTSQADSA
jgi:hypothetical protein